MTAFRDGEVVLRSERRTEGFTESLLDIGYQGVEPGDLVIHSMDAFAGAMGISKSHGKMSPVVHIYTGPETVDLRFQQYFLRHLSSAGYIQSLAKGIRERSTSFDPQTLADVPLPLPPLEEQRRIADFLDDQVARIEALMAARAAQRAQLEARYRAAAEDLVCGRVSSELTEAAWKPFDRIPIHWRETRLRSVRALLQTGPFGSQLHSDDYVDDGWPVVNPGSLKDSRIVPVPGMAVDAATRARLERHVLRQGDVVFGRRGELGRAGLVTPDEDGWLLGTGSLLVRLLTFDELRPAYLMRLLETDAVRYYFNLLAVGSTMANLNVPILGGTPLLLPPVDEQELLVARHESLQTQSRASVAAIDRSIDLLNEYKRSLITAAVTGEFDVSAASGRGVPA